MADQRSQGLCRREFDHELVACLCEDRRSSEQDWELAGADRASGISSSADMRSPRHAGIGKP